MLKCFGLVEKMHVWKENNPLLFFSVKELMLVSAFLPNLGKRVSNKENGNLKCFPYLHSLR